MFESSAPIIEEIILLELKIDQKEQEADDLTRELEDLQSSLDAFLASYYARVGKYYVELDRLKLQIQEYRYRLHLFEQDPADRPDWKGYDREVNEAFSYQRERVHDLEKELNEFEEAAMSDGFHRSSILSSDPTLKGLYRKLAFHFHPDRAQDEEERAQYHEIMSRINDAYGSGDVETLEKLSRKLSLEERLKNESPEGLLKHLKHVYEQVFVLIRQLKADKESLLNNESYKLHLKVEEARFVGRDLLAELARDVQDDIEDCQKELIQLKEKAQDAAYPGAVYG